MLSKVDPTTGLAKLQKPRRVKKRQLSFGVGYDANPRIQSGRFTLQVGAEFGSAALDSEVADRNGNPEVGSSVQGQLSELDKAEAESF